MNLNKVMLVGRVARVPELKALPSGSSVASFSLATNSSYKNKTGEKVEDTQFHNIVIFGSLADVCSKYLTKGQLAFVEGKLVTRSWEKEGGQKMYRTEIIAAAVQFGPKAGNSAPGSEERHEDEIDIETGDKRPATRNKGSDKMSPPFVKKGEAKDSPDQMEYPEEEINPDDIPF